jgi:integrase
VNNVWRDWNHLVKAAGIQEATVHDLRRSAITHWARVLPIHVTHELAGHTRIETTRKHYLCISQHDLNDARTAAASVVQGVILDADDGKVTQE